MMKRKIFTVLMMAAAISLNAQQWQDLFNGKDLEGWEKLDGSAEFQVENGEVIGVSRTGTPNTFLATKKVYGDFILEYEMKMECCGNPVDKSDNELSLLMINNKKYIYKGR